MNIRCPNCDKEIPGKECPDCGEITPVESKYCINCGVILHQVREEIISDDNDLDFENRILCSDGTCTGIIIDGKCCECGKRPRK